MPRFQMGRSRTGSRPESCPTRASGLHFGWSRHAPVPGIGIFLTTESGIRFIISMSEPAHGHLPHLSPFASEPLVFVTVVAAGRRVVLDNEEAHEILRGVWARSAEKNGWWVGDYLLMPNHVHFFARASRTADPMKKWVQIWKSVSARALLKRCGLAGPLWQEDYFDRYLRSGENYTDKWRYVEVNPVRAGLVEQPEDWPYRGQIHPLRF